VGSTLDPDLQDVMRVSVVATGIDAAQARAETPMSPHRVAEPARPEPIRASAATAAAPRPSFGAQRTAAETPAPAAPAPVPAPVPAASNLFAAPEAQGFADDGMFDLDDGSLARPSAARDAEPARDNPFVTAERAPDAVAAARPAPALRPAPAPKAEEERAPRFGFNNLIHRMTGAAAKETKESPFTSAALRKEPAAAPAPRPAAEPRDDEDMRMEIPAFLRRQAN
jgi:cell division protein FtsZ